MGIGWFEYKIDEFYEDNQGRLVEVWISGEKFIPEWKCKARIKRTKKR